ncbi:phytoene desaturase family protein [Streptomyces reniochalinae]|uniref:NAD(P)/FAD-dependent oxidoreductase n=1 Tax=Streptomyces reniochalinae TaxID=2250578 RepID=A0A367EEW0_9ACTN|nr:NAD(P)/FAD-dependent oxidoreductase [Streptomyces reniochalinae]RCG16604.1 NAD(P)/FAD-dependent oxidoreductase [Streptomyces reniochalinae]
MGRIAVVGAGLGGMAAAARLAVAGHEVTVYERSDTYGGAVRRYARDGFAFDTGPGLLHLPAVYRDLFVKTGRERLEDVVDLVQVPVTALHVFQDGTSVTLPNASRGKVVAALDDGLGTGAGERWAQMLTRAREAWEVCRRPLLEEPLREEPSSRGALERDGAYPALRRRGLPRLPLVRGGRGGRRPTLAEVAEDELRDPRLAAMVCGGVRAHGLDPARTPAGAALLAYVEDSFGTWYVRGGGMRALAEALHERCLQRRVVFRFGCQVAAVREKDGRAAGLELADGTAADADVVLAGGGPAAPGGPADTGAGAARLTVLLALRGARPRGTAHRTLVHGAPGPGGPLTVLRPDDPALRPDEAHETAVLSSPVPPGAVTGSAEAEQLAERLLAAADEAGLGLGERLLWHEVRTPADNEAETGAPGGRVPPPSLPGAGGAFLRPANQASPLSGLYAVGGWSHPGGGLPAAGMSGAMAAGLVQDPDWRGSV